MILLDVNILLHLFNEQSPAHSPVKAWIYKVTNGGQWIGIPTQVLWSFVRIATHPRASAIPMKGDEAMDAVNTLLEGKQIRLIHPGPRHFELLTHLVAEESATGNLVPDAVLVALALEYGATIASTDNDFRRFAVPWINPAKEKSK